MADAAQTLLAMAKDRPDPKMVTDWIVAYLGKKPLDARRAALTSLAAEFSKPRPPPETRAAGLILRVVQKLIATIR